LKSLFCLNKLPSAPVISRGVLLGRLERRANAGAHGMTAPG
jgi:hypothetical protein